MAKTAPTKPTRRSQVRLLPAVIGVSLILIALKASGLSFPARAAIDTAAPAPTATPNQTAAPKPASAPLASINSALPMPPKTNAQADSAPERPADDLPLDLAGAGVSSAEMDVLTSLSDRRDALDERERQLDLKANLITAAEKRVDDKILQLKDLQTRIEALLGQRDQMETAQLDNLVKIYSSMKKPQDAARIFASLDDQVRLSVASRMKAADLANILPALPPDVAQKLTVELANRYALPRDVGAAVASAATTAPAAATAAPAAAAAAPATSVPPAPAPTMPAAAPSETANSTAKPGG